MNKFLKPKTRKIITYFLLFILVFSGPISSLRVNAVSEYDTADAIHISTVEDFLSFAENCTVDTWSHDKVFVLDKDLDLTGIDFESVPTFGGIFLGQGHVIKGFSLTGGSNYIGLFRYIQESGEIYGLSVSGTAQSESGHSGLALLAGCNYGLISGCSTSGNVTGKDQVGSIAGVNEVTGVITDCDSNGVVYGTHLIGGIAGSNKGSILNSTNHCFINTSASNPEFDLSSFNIDTTINDFLTTENAASVTDIGGISGSSSGIIRACTNDGSIGYQHVGYNIGGITGSQTGYIEGCINYGLLNGRKDVGGIAGQMEPSSELEFSEDTLSKLHTELDKLHQLLTQLDRDASGASSSLTGQIDQLLTSVEGAQAAVNEILDNASGYFNDFSNLTDLTTLPSPRPVSLEFLDDLALPTPSPSPTPTIEPSSAPTAEPSSAPTAEPSSTPTIEPTPNGNEVENPPLDDHFILYASDTTDDTDGDTNSDTDNDSGDKTDTSSNPFPAGWPADWPTPTISGNSILDNLDREQVEKDINSAQEHVYEDASNTIRNLQNNVQNQASIISSRIASSRNSLNSSFSAIISDMRLLNTMLNDENQIILNDFQAIIDEINVIGDLLTNSSTNDPDDILEDVSDEDQLTDTTGKVMNCTNNGKVNGDLNVGGIAGSLSRENNFDPEDDYELDENEITLKFSYKERIVIRQCKNNGIVTGKKDCIGGIAGEMSLGSIIDCISIGTITSEGSMVGGIAGSSTSTIRSSSAKCTLKGSSQIGGIAGYGSTIFNCYSMVQINKGEYYLGSIAGNVDSDGTISDNYFVEGCPAGIDGISYEGKAQPLSYEEFMTSSDLPDIFNSIYLTFVADDKTVSVVTLNYGDTFDPASLPEVPFKEGCIGRWEEFDQTSVTFDQTIGAIYDEYVTTLESTLKIGERPIVLIESTFAPEDTFSLSQDNAYPTDSAAKSECWKINISGASTDPYNITIRYLIPEEMQHPQIKIYQDGSWMAVETEIDGSYYVLPPLSVSTGHDIVFSCIDRPSSSINVILVIVVCAAVFIMLALTVTIVKKKRGLKK